jgi:hypothetical protein
MSQHTKASVLDAEGCITLRQTVIGEGAYEVEIRVEHLDGSEAEISGKEERSRGIGANSQSFVDRCAGYIRYPRRKLRVSLFNSLDC